MERALSQPGAVGLVLPTLPQSTVPGWVVSTVPNPPDAPRLGTPTPAEELATICQRAEALGAGTLWATDHLFWHGPALETVVALTVAAGATKKSMVGSCIIQLPLRHAPVVAKQASSLQLLSQGRMILGVGVGSHAGEYQQAGVSFAARGRQLDAGITELRRSWATGVGVTTGDVQGDAADRYRQIPSPTVPVPLWVGGSSEAALRRAASLADGWIPLFLSPDEYASSIDRLAKEVDRAGRPVGSVTPAMVLFVSIDDVDTGRSLRGTDWMSSLYGIPAKAFERHLVSGTARSVADTVAAYQTAGAEHIAVYITNDDPLPQFERLMAAMPANGMAI